MANLGRLLNLTPIGKIIGTNNTFGDRFGLFGFLQKGKGQSGLSNLWRSMTGSGLTDAQKEANIFEANQAQRQMDFQQQMRDTQYQSAVNDMKSAGLNPALMYGSGASGNAAPSGAMAASESPGAPDVVGLLGQIQNLALLNSQKRNLDANTGKTIAETDLTKQNVVNSAATYNKLVAEVRNLGLSGDAQEIVNKYLERNQQVALQNMTLEGDKLAAEWTEIQQKISNLSTEEKKMLQEIAESKQRVNYLLSQTALNEEQIKEVSATISKINQERDNLVKVGKLTDKDIDFYEWNHGERISAAGINAGVRYWPNKNQRDKNR